MTIQLKTAPTHLDSEFLDDIGWALDQLEIDGFREQPYDYVAVYQKQVVGNGEDCKGFVLKPQIDSECRSIGS